MILVFSPGTSNRLTYILDLLLTQLAGFTYELCHDIVAFRSFEGAKINYSSFAAEDAINILPSGLLDETGISKSPPPLASIRGETLLFPVFNESHLPFDLLSASFYLVTFYEEYQPHPADEHGRLRAADSIMYRTGRLDQAVVNRWALTISEDLNRRFGIVPEKKRKFRVQPTFDIDQAWCFKNKGFSRNLGGLIRDKLHWRIGDVWRRWAVMLGGHDPFDTYAYIFEIHEKYLLNPVFFILSGKHGPYDKNIPITHPQMQALVRRLDCHGMVGLHPSYASNEDPALLKKESEDLGKTLTGPVIRSRQHYLRLKFPDTYRALLEAGIRHDFTAGFADMPGFRCGICDPFLFYDLEEEKTTSLTIHPFTVMDGTLRDYMKLEPDEATGLIRKLIDEVRTVRGCFIPLWHNESLSEYGRWKGWRILYENMLHYSI